MEGSIIGDRPLLYVSWIEDLSEHVNILQIRCFRANSKRQQYKRPTYGGELIKREKMAKQGIEGLLHSTVHLLCYVANLSLKKPLLALHSLAQSKV